MDKIDEFRCAIIVREKLKMEAKAISYHPAKATKKNYTST